MSRSTYSRLTLIGGITTGILIGAIGMYAFYQWENDKPSAALDAYQLDPPTKVAVNRPIVDTSQQTKVVKTGPEQAVAEDVPEVVLEIELNDDSLEISNVMESDSIQSDSLTAALPTDEDPVSATAIIIRRDEMISFREIKLKILNDTSFAETDSLTQKSGELLGLEPVAKPTMLKTEFWKSPLNYKGYKMGKNKLLLYGVAQPDSVVLIRDGEFIFLQMNAKTYKLKNTDQFLPFQPAALPDKH